MSNLSKISRRTILSAIMFAIFAISLSAQTGDTWQKVEAPAEGFSILMPTKATKTEDPPSPNSSETLYSYTSSADGVNYTVITAAVSGIDWKQVANRDSFFSGFDSGACGASREAKNTCDVKMLRELQQVGLPARDFRLAVNGETVAMGRIVFNATRVYTLLVVAQGIETKTAGLKKFVDSFGILAR